MNFDGKQISVWTIHNEVSGSGPAARKETI